MAVRGRILMITDHGSRRLKRLNDQKFEPYIVEYNLKEN